MTNTPYSTELYRLPAHLKSRWENYLLVFTTEEVFLLPGFFGKNMQTIVEHDLASNLLALKTIGVPIVDILNRWTHNEWVKSIEDVAAELSPEEEKMLQGLYTKT